MVQNIGAIIKEFKLQFHQTDVDGLARFVVHTVRLSDSLLKTCEKLGDV